MSSNSQSIKYFKNILQCLLQNSIFMELKPKVAQVSKTVKYYYISSAPQCANAHWEVEEGCSLLYFLHHASTSITAKFASYYILVHVTKSKYWFQFIQLLNEYILPLPTLRLVLSCVCFWKNLLELMNYNLWPRQCPIRSDVKKINSQLLELLVQVP